MVSCPGQREAHQHEHDNCHCSHLQCIVTALVHQSSGHITYLFEWLHLEIPNEKSLNQKAVHQRTMTVHFRTVYPRQINHSAAWQSKAALSNATHIHTFFFLYGYSPGTCIKKTGLAGHQQPGSVAIKQ
jgi:hypothetical protein